MSDLSRVYRAKFYADTSLFWQGAWLVQGGDKDLANYRPAIVLSIEHGVAHGSCRSLPGFDVLGGLEACAGLLDRFGGHKQAAGLQLDAAKIPAFRRAINDYAAGALSPDDLRPNLSFDGPLDFDVLTPRVVSDLMAMAPFGLAIPKPVFSASGIDVVDGPRRLKERHLKMSLRQKGRTFRAMDDVPLVIMLQDIQPVGRYAFQITWSDGHDTGIYSYTFLRRLCQCDLCQPVKPVEPRSRRLL